MVSTASNRGKNRIFITFVRSPRPPQLFCWCHRRMNTYFRVSIRVKVKLDYIQLDSVRLKVRLTRLTSGVCMHLYVEGTRGVATSHLHNSTTYSTGHPRDNRAQPVDTR